MHYEGSCFTFKGVQVVRPMLQFQHCACWLWVISCMDTVCRSIRGMLRLFVACSLALMSLSDNELVTKNTSSMVIGNTFQAWLSVLFHLQSTLRLSFRHKTNFRHGYVCLPGSLHLINYSLHSCADRGLQETWHPVNELPWPQQTPLQQKRNVAYETPALVTPRQLGLRANSTVTLIRI